MKCIPFKLLFFSKSSGNVEQRKYFTSWRFFAVTLSFLVISRTWLSPNWEVSTEHLRRMWHASRERLHFLTPGSVSSFGDLLMLQLLRPVLPNLPYLFSTFHPEYPLVLSLFSILLLHFSQETNTNYFMSINIKKVVNTLDKRKDQICFSAL